MSAELKFQMFFRKDLCVALSEVRNVSSGSEGVCTDGILILPFLQQNEYSFFLVNSPGQRRA